MTLSDVEIQSRNHILALVIGSFPCPTLTFVQPVRKSKIRALHIIIGSSNSHIDNVLIHLIPNLNPIIQIPRPNNKTSPSPPPLNP